MSEGVFKLFHTSCAIPPPKKTVEAWKALAKVMDEHGLFIDTSKVVFGEDDDWMCLNHLGGAYFATKLGRFDAQSLHDYIEKCEMWFGEE